MTGRLHICAASRCTLEVPFKMLMCRRHWFMVPKPLRKEIIALWQKVKQARHDHDARDIAAENHHTASMNAVMIVDQREREYASTS